MEHQLPTLICKGPEQRRCHLCNYGVADSALQIRLRDQRTHPVHDRPMACLRQRYLVWFAPLRSHCFFLLDCADARAITDLPYMRIHGLAGRRVRTKVGRFFHFGLG